MLVSSVTTSRQVNFFISKIFSFVIFYLIFLFLFQIFPKPPKNIQVWIFLFPFLFHFPISGFPLCPTSETCQLTLCKFLLFRKISPSRFCFVCTSKFLLVCTCPGRGGWLHIGTASVSDEPGHKQCKPLFLYKSKCILNHDLLHR